MNKTIQSDQIILFDGVCNFCSGIVKFIIRRDKKAKFKFTPLQSDFSKNLLQQFDIIVDITNLDTFVYFRHDKAYVKSTAALYVLRDIGGLYRLLFVFIIIPNFIRNFLYSLISKSRYRIWGKRDKCMVPTPEIIDRFI